MLARLKMSHMAIHDAVLNIDDARLSIDNLKALKHSAPTAEEVIRVAPDFVFKRGSDSTPLMVHRITDSDDPEFPRGHLDARIERPVLPKGEGSTD
jgi:hypothetical protein